MWKRKDKVINTKVREFTGKRKEIKKITLRSYQRELEICKTQSYDGCGKNALNQVLLNSSVILSFFEHSDIWRLTLIKVC